MKRSTLAVAAMAVTLGWAGLADANPGMSPPAKAPPVQRHNPRPYPVPPRISQRVPPVVIARTPPVVVPIAPAVASPIPTVPAGVTLTNGAWVARNPLTGMYSVAFDSPGFSGSGILLQAGYTNVVLGPTNWIDARTYLKSIEAPGW